MRRETTAAGKMADARVRRLFVPGDADRCLGVISTGALARNAEPCLSGEVVEEIPKPGSWVPEAAGTPFPAPPPGLKPTT